MAETAKLPRPGYENITSTTAVPPSREPRDSPRSVISGHKAFGNTCLQRIVLSFIPLALAPIT